MKKKNYFYLAALSLAMTFSMGACSDNNDPNPDGWLERSGQPGLQF